MLGQRDWSHLGALAVLLLNSACFDDPAEIDSGSESGAADDAADDGLDDAAGDDAIEDDTSDDEGPGGCQGCLDAAGGCLPGNVDQACGALAETCVTCPDGTTCAEGECVQPPACTPDNCDGCCDGDTCNAGDQALACGEQGSQCVECPGGASCEAGACELACADTCLGCCAADDTCVEPGDQTAQACGFDAQTCETCAAELECIEGSCISTLCAAQCDGCCVGDECLGGDAPRACGKTGQACVACPDGTECGDSGCAPPPGSLWDLVAIDGTVSSVDPDGDLWDFAGLPDPYVVATIDGTTNNTDFVDNTVFPEWQEVVFSGLTAEALQEEWTLQVFDDDFTPDPSMGSCTTSIPSDAFGLVLSIECSAGPFLAWTLNMATVPSPD